MVSTKIKLYMLLVGIIMAGCFKVSYSAKGYSIPPEVKTIAIQYFNNTASFAPSSLGQDITDLLRDRFIKETNLLIVEGSGDVNFEGEITRFESVSSSIRANDQAGQQKFIIAINVRYINNIDPQQDFEARFERFREYSADVDFSTAQDTHLEDILNELIDDIFNKAFVNW